MQTEYTFADEEWRDVAGFEGLYQVSNYGRVRSLDRVVVYKDGRLARYKGKIRKQCLNQDGYPHVQLCKDSQSTKTMRIHRMVAEAFIPNPLSLPEINHKDEVKTNNYVGNLEWCDHLYNSRYGTRNARTGYMLGKPVSIAKDGIVVKKFHSTKEAARYLGVRSQPVDYAKNHGTNCCGYKVIPLEEVE